MPVSYIIFVGVHVCDCSGLDGKLVDLGAGERRKLLSEKNGFARMFQGLTLISPESRAAAGVPDHVYEELLSVHESIGLIDQKYPAAEKLLEVLGESRAFYVDKRENLIGLMVDTIRSRASRRKDPSIRAPFEELIGYHSQKAAKAAKTRRQAKARQQQEELAKAAALKDDGAAGQPNDEHDAPASARTPVSKRAK
jgi:hypothetical protein